MNRFEAVLKRTGASRATRVIVGGATAAVLFLSPVMGTLAAPAGVHAPSMAVFQDDDREETKIVPRGSDSSADEESDDDVLDLDVDSEDAEEGDSEDRDDEDADNGQGDRIFLTGIVSSKVDLSPNQWMGALDERLTKPFAAAAQPVRLSSDAIDLDAEITRGEIVNGEMQTPKDENDVVWYKETANPGKAGNMVFAGHLNWYGFPEAVFHDIDQLKKGDKIVVRGEDGVDYVYKVKWVKLVATADADMDAVVGPTQKASLTLITCGGEWDPTVSLYKDRTVVRAELVDASR